MGGSVLDRAVILDRLKLPASGAQMIKEFGLSAASRLSLVISDFGELNLIETRLGHRGLGYEFGVDLIEEPR